MTEEWRPVSWPEGYEVSSLGRVRNSRTGRVLALLPHDKGYVKVKLGRKRYEYVQRLVCEAWHGPPDKASDHADHIDFDRTNNTPGNLRWLPQYLNAWRWETTESDIAPPDHEPMTPEEDAALEAAEQVAGW